MPIGQYDRYFGGKKGSAQEAYDAMQKQYGPKKGRSIFYGKVEKRRQSMRGAGLRKTVLGKPKVDRLTPGDTADAPGGLKKAVFGKR